MYHAHGKDLYAGKWLNEEMIVEYMLEKKVSRQKAIDVLALIPEVQPPLSKREKEWPQKVVQDMIDNPERYKASKQ